MSKRIYVAGSMSNPNPLKFLENLRRGIRVSAELVLLNYHPFSPFIDFQFFLALRNDEKITIEMIQAYSMAWLEVSEAVLVLPGWESSKGTVAEVARAQELGIPVYYSMEELIDNLDKDIEIKHMHELTEFDEWGVDDDS